MQTLQYPIFLKTFVFSMLFGLFWTNTVSHYYFLMNSAQECFEICDPIDSESEKEGKKLEIDEDDKFRSNAPPHKHLFANSLLKMWLLADFQSMHPPAIPTPPPELMAVYC